MTSRTRNSATTRKLSIALGILSLSVGLAMSALLAIYALLPDLWNGIARVTQRTIIQMEDRYYDGRIEEDDFSLENAAERAALPEFRTTAALEPEQRTPHIPAPNVEPGSWPRSTGDSAAQRFSPLRQVTPANVAQLNVAWRIDDTVARNIQATPVFDGKNLIIVTPSGTIQALDPATGRTRWDFKPSNPPAKRGMLVGPALPQTRAPIYFAAGKALYALDSETGEPLASFDGGRVRLNGESKVAPAICGERIVTANAGERPSVEAFDRSTGERLWTTALIPSDLPTGTGSRPSRQAGGSPWGGFSLDTARCIAFVSTGNPAPVLVGVERRGSNPGSNSIIALDLEHGRILWRFQEVAHDLWDLDIPAAPILISITLDDQQVDVVAAATKAGNLLLLDRLSGKPIFDWRLRRAPVSRVPGERTHPYQPAPLLPEPFARQEFSIDEVTTISSASRSAVMAQLANASFGFYVPPEPNSELVFYGLHGGAEWPGAAADPNAGAIFVAASNVPSILRLVPERQVTLDEGHPGRAVYKAKCAACHGNDLQGGEGPAISDAGYRLSDSTIRSIVFNGQQAMPPVAVEDRELAQVIGYLHSGTASATSWPRYRRADYARLYDHRGHPGSRPPWGTLSRIDLGTGRIAWQVPLGRDKALEAEGIFDTGTENIGGLLTTASGLVFATGTKDAMIHAHAASDGRLLWSHPLPFIGSAPPMTFAYQGAQYIVVPATGGGTLQLYDDRVAAGGSLVAFKLATIQ